MQLLEAALPRNRPPRKRTPSSQAMTTETSPIASAFGALYRNPRVGDLIIRTTDEVDFHVYKAIIAAASIVFADMLSIPQPSPGATTGDSYKPAVEVAESSVVWETLIMLCYAPQPPTPEAFEDLAAVRAVLAAGVKYQMAVAVDYARLVLLLPKFMEEKPFAVYALGCAYKLPDVARTAARCSLRHPIYFEYSEELDILPPRASHHLSEYRRKCGASAQMLVTKTHSDYSSHRPGGVSRSGQTYHVPFEFHQCTERSCISNYSSPSSYTGPCRRRITAELYFQDLRTKLEFLPDARLALSKPLLQAMIDAATTCITCVNTIHTRVASFSEALYAAIEDVISKVRRLLLSVSN